MPAGASRLPGGDPVFLPVFFALLLASLLVRAGPVPTFASMAGAFYRAGALVFGGGHVVLPLLQQAVVATGWVHQETFLAGYGAAQAMPGPMFSLAAFLGAEMPLQAPPALAAAVAVLAIFLPGFLLLGAALPLWSRVGTHPLALRAVAGMNAAVVGLLAAAFYDPVWKQGVGSVIDVAVAGIAFGMLATMKRAALWVVLWCVASALLLHAGGA